MTKDDERPRAPATVPEKTSRLEWAVALAGLVVVLGAAGYMIAYAMTGAKGPPILQIAQVSVTPMGARYALRFEARNAGASTAAGVQVAAELTAGIVTAVESGALPAERLDEGGAQEDPEKAGGEGDPGGEHPAKHAGRAMSRSRKEAISNTFQI